MVRIAFEILLGTGCFLLGMLTMLGIAWYVSKKDDEEDWRITRRRQNKVYLYDIDEED